MNIIEQRILIPASPDAVWQYIGNISNNPLWQVNCADISFLTTANTGRGIRWRYTTSNGKARVIEVSAWYDRVGYEYTIVDGTPFQENKGRIRLKEDINGTIVQWTFQYDVKGAFGRLRNVLGIRRKNDNAIIKSLQNLWRNITESHQGEVYTAKSVMREAPGVEARFSYTPKHPSAIHDEIKQQQQAISITEPPVSDDDTKPNPAFIQPEVHTPATEFQKQTEPDFLADLPEEIPSTPQPPQPVASVPVRAAPQPLPKPDVPAQPPVAPIPAEEQPYVTPAPETPLPLPLLGHEDLDTSEISVFDIFGLKKPSESQEVKAIMWEDSITTEIPAVREEMVSRRMGLRAIMRHRRAKLRRPK